MSNFNIAKANIAFGFILFIFSASIGPYMAAKFVDQNSERSSAQTAMVGAMGKIQSLKTNEFKGELDDKPELLNVGTVLADGIVKTGADINARKKAAAVKTAHAHGNLESLLNITVGLVLMFMAGPAIARLIIGSLFIFGALLHSGLMYIVFYPPFNQPGWAMSLFQLGIGPILLITGLASMAVATILWLKVPNRE